MGGKSNSFINKPLGDVGDYLGDRTGIKIDGGGIKTPIGSIKRDQALAAGALMAGGMPLLGAGIVGSLVPNLLKGMKGPNGEDIQAPDINTLNEARQIDLLAQEAANRDRAGKYAEQLQAITEGRKLDPAAALQQQMNLSQQVAAAKANRGVSSALASRNIGQQMAQQRALQGAAGIANAQQQYGGFLQGQQQLAQQGLTSQEQLKSNEAIARAGYQAQAAAANRARSDAQAGFLGSLAGAGAGFALGGPAGAAMGSQFGREAGTTFLSDENGKKNIQSAKNTPMDPEHFLSKLSSSSYEYKNKKHGKGTFISPMAQELEKAGPVGKSMVKDTPEGKMVDYGRGFGAILAAQADLNERLKKVEGKKA